MYVGEVLYVLQGSDSSTVIVESSGLKYPDDNEGMHARVDEDKWALGKNTALLTM